MGIIEPAILLRSTPNANLESWAATERVVARFFEGIDFGDAAVHATPVHIRQRYGGPEWVASSAPPPTQLQQYVWRRDAEREAFAQRPGNQEHPAVIAHNIAVANDHELIPSLLTATNMALWDIAGGVGGQMRSGGGVQHVAMSRPRPLGPTIRNAHLAGQKHPVTGIPFNRRGYPSFSGVAIKTVRIQQTGNRRVDEAAANMAAGYAETPEGFTWHHHQDKRTMQLVPRDTHYKTGHTGGVAQKKRSGG
jgi:hypothetical protein